MTNLEQLINDLCPDGVIYKSLNECVDIMRGTRVVKNNLSEDGKYPVYQNSLTPMGYHIESNASKDTTFIIVAGAAGEIGYSTVDFWAADDCFCLKCHQEITSRFLYHLLLQQQSYIYSKVRKASIPRLSRTVVEKITIPVPPLPVQAEIVRILDNFTQLEAEIEAEIEAELEARRKQYEHYRDVLLSFDMNGGGTANCEWRTVKLLDMLCQPITDGPHTTPSFADKGIPFISVDSIWNGRIHFENMRGYITEEFDLECCKKYKPQMHDVYMVKSGSTTGKVAYVDTDQRFNIWSPLAAMRVNDNNSSRYLYHLLQTKRIQEMVRVKASHGSQPNLGMRELEKFEVSIPPLDEQLRLVEILDRFDALCNDITQGLPAEVQARRRQYEYYRDKLLSFQPLA